MTPSSLTCDVLVWNPVFCYQEHPGLTKLERKNLCGLMDVKKLTVEASMHAAQNDRLPLRVIVQVLFYEQLRATSNVRSLSNTHCDPPNSITSGDEDSEKTEGENVKLSKKNSKNSKSGTKLVPSRSRRIFGKLWIVGRGQGENRSSETSGSSDSPNSVVPVDNKSSGSSSRQRRHSIS